jgi:thiol:disulfide interchange protein DsbD
VRRGLIIFCAGLLLAFLFSAATPAPAQTPSGREVVSPSAYASSEPVARGSSFQLAVVMKIRKGFHVNAHEASADYLIPTTIRAELPSGFKSDGDTAYPKGELHTFSFSKTPLNVYQGNVVLRFPVSALPNAPLGTQHLPLKLRYQACSNEICLPPVTVDVDATITVAATPAEARPAHRELFPAR